MRRKDFIIAFIKSHLLSYPTPINLNYFWSFGALAGVCFVSQVVTGIFLAMHYIPHVDFAFNSVEHIMRNVNYGWFFRYAHSNGASMFFICIYGHIFRGLYYSSNMKSKALLWASGIIIFLLMMAIAFLGYVLPWGQMSFWGATVITNLFSAIPFVGSSIVEWLWGGFSVGKGTLNRFYSLHYALPFLLGGAIFIHLSLLHKEGSSNPTGANTNVEIIPFFPYYYVKDLVGFFCFLISFGVTVFFYPNALGHPDNYIMANPLSTPAHIVPEWYFLPFYAILRTIPSKIGGVLFMFGAIIILLIYPWISKPKQQSAKIRPLFVYFYWLLVVDFFLLGWIGQKPVEDPYILIGSITTFYFFFFFLVIVPLVQFSENESEGHLNLKN
jgi:ubiquinol-cytochrome c reductase cytochrome b subunit